MRPKPFLGPSYEALIEYPMEAPAGGGGGGGGGGTRFWILANITRMVRPMTKTHKITLNGHQPRIVDGGVWGVWHNNQNLHGSKNMIVDGGVWGYGITTRIFMFKKYDCRWRGLGVWHNNQNLHGSKNMIVDGGVWGYGITTRIFMVQKI